MKGFRFNCKEEEDRIKKFYSVEENYLDIKVTEIAIRNIMADVADCLVEQYNNGKGLKYTIEIGLYDGDVVATVK